MNHLNIQTRKDYMTKIRRCISWYIHAKITCLMVEVCPRNERERSQSVSTLIACFILFKNDVYLKYRFVI